MADEAYKMVSVPKKSSNAGRPKGKKSFIILFLWKDVAEHERDEKGVRVTKFKMATGKKPIAVYATDSMPFKNIFPGPLASISSSAAAQG